MGRPHQILVIGFAVLVLTDVGRASARPQTVDGLKPVLHSSEIPAPGSAITLAQAIDLALANNPQTRTAWLEARAAEFAVGSARSAYFPEIDVLANATRSRSSTPGASAATIIAPSLALTYLLFDFGGRAAEVEQAQQTLIAATFANNVTMRDVVLLVAQP